MLGDLHKITKKRLNLKTAIFQYFLKGNFNKNLNPNSKILTKFHFAFVF